MSTTPDARTAEPLAGRCAAWADRFGMLPGAGETMLCAVSGGADSVCMLLLLREIAAERGFSLVCAHYDHRLRGEESARDAEFVRALCERLEIPFVLGSGDVAGAAGVSGRGLEETAREMRYAFLRRAAAEAGAVRIATAHTAEDNAETMLLCLARGAGSRGLGGIAPRRGEIVRPLLFAARREIEAFLESRGQPYVTDSSNASTEFARNRLRLEALPALREVNGAFARHALEAAERLREDEEYLACLAADFLKTHAEETEDTLSVPASALGALPRPVFFRALRQICGAALTAAHAEAVRALLSPDSGGKAADLPGLRVTRSFDSLVFAPRGETAGLKTRELGPDAELALPEAGLTVRRTDGVVCPEKGPVYNSYTILYFARPLPCDTITVKRRAPGDSLRLYGRRCTKSLKKLFAEARIPACRRDLIPVLKCGEAVLAAAGLGAAEGLLARPGAEAVRIEFIQNNNDTGEDRQL